MPNEILSTLIQASGAAGVSVAFIWYLVKRDKSDKEMIERFTHTTIENTNLTITHIQKSTQVIQEVSDTNRELKTVIEKLYDQNYKLSKKKSSDSIEHSKAS